MPDIDPNRAVAIASAELRLENADMTPEARAIVKAAAAGEITRDEALAKIRELHGFDAARPRP